MIMMTKISYSVLIIFSLSTIALGLSSNDTTVEGPQESIGSSVSPQEELVRSTASPIEVLTKWLITFLDKLIAFINMSRPDSSLPERTEFKEQALTDHTNDEIFSSSSQEIIERSGFKQETHYTTTKDGYITELIHIINPLADQSKLKQPPIMIFHGAIVETSTYLWNSAIQHHPEKYPREASDGPITSANTSLGFMLPNYGFNVWLVATRGSNKRNIGHKSLKPKLLEDILAKPLDLKGPLQLKDTLKFYEFTQDELVEIEFPAQIDRVRNLTGSSKVSTITYSISTQVMFKVLASDQETSKKIYTHVAIAPVLNRVGSDTLLYAAEDLALAIPTDVGNLFVQLFLNDITRELLRKLDRYTITYYILTFIVGPSPRFQTFLSDPVIGHVLKPVSFGELIHYNQQVIPGRLQKYDHGVAKNLLLYGQPKPPVHNISDIELKRWMLVAGDTDLLGTIDSADQYVKQIPHKPYKYLRYTNGWNHFDSAAGFEVDTKVNLPILDFFDHFSSLDANEIAQAD